MKLVRSVASGVLLLALPAAPAMAAEAPSVLTVDLAKTRPAISGRKLKLSKTVPPRPKRRWTASW